MDQVDNWIRMLQDGNIGQREAAANGLGRLSDGRAIEPLRKTCMCDCAPSVRKAAGEALKALGVEPPPWVEDITPKEYRRQKIEALIRNTLDRSPNTKHEKETSRHTVSTESVLREGDFELRYFLETEDDCLCGYGLTVIYRGQEVFADRHRDRLYIPGEWEALLARLLDKDKGDAACSGVS